MYSIRLSLNVERDTLAKGKGRNKIGLLPCIVNNRFSKKHELNIFVLRQFSIDRCFFFRVHAWNGEHDLYGQCVMYDYILNLVIFIYVFNGSDSVFFYWEWSWKQFGWNRLHWPKSARANNTKKRIIFALSLICHIYPQPTHEVALEKCQWTP